MKTLTAARCSAESRPHSRAEGFSLLEMVFSLALLSFVLAVVLQAIVQLQQRNFTGTAKVDTVQETRDFVDQMVRDIHDVGYPPPLVVYTNVNPVPACSTRGVNVACGLIYFSPTQIQYEGDLDGTGTVYEVLVQLKVPPSGKCPCVLQRGAITKAAYLAGGAPTYFTEVNGVLNSGNGAGAATYPISLPGHGDYTAYGTADVFTSYDVHATPDPVGTCSSAAACSSIRSLQITANVVPNYMDPKTDVFPVYSITSKGRFNNLTSPN